MIPENCVRTECEHYRDEGHIRYCKHPEYDLETNECQGALYTWDRPLARGREGK